MLEIITFIISCISIILSVFVIYYNFLKKGRPVIVIPNRYSIDKELMYVDYDTQKLVCKITFPLTFVNKGAKSVIIDRIYAKFISKEIVYCEWKTQQKGFAYTENNDLAMPFSIEKYSSIIKICTFHFYNGWPKLGDNIVHINAVYDQNKKIIIKFRLKIHEGFEDEDFILVVNDRENEWIKQIKNIKSPIYKRSK
ncbi:MAG: hypothetical protein ACFFG0_32080 [Candidatus Thorarchaeota archaeon]